MTDALKIVRRASIEGGQWDEQTLPLLRRIYAARGALFETWVVSEAIKRKYNAGQPADLHFWRDSAGHEVDLLEETPQGLRATEIKSGTTFAPDWLAGVEKWQGIAGKAIARPILIYGGDTSFEREQCDVLSWRDFVTQ